MLLPRAWQFGLCLCACSVFPERAELPEGSGGSASGGTASGGRAEGGDAGAPNGGSLPLGGSVTLGGSPPLGGSRPFGGSPPSGGSSSFAGSPSLAGAGGVEPGRGGAGGSGALGGTDGGCTVFTLAPSADAWISEESPSKNFGDEPNLQVGSLALDRAHALLSFDVREIPAGSNVERAELELELRTSPGEERLLCAYRVPQEWRENQVTWQRPRSGRSWESGGGADVVEPPSVSLELPSGTAARTQISFTVTADVIDMLSAAAPNHGWAIREERPDAARLELTAKELEVATPVLRVTTCP